MAKASFALWISIARDWERVFGDRWHIRRALAQVRCNAQSLEMYELHPCSLLTCTWIAV